MTGSTIYIKQNDVLPIVAATLYDGAGPVNLSSATVTFVMKNPTTGAVVVNAACAIVSAVAGTVTYTWISADTATAASYNAEFQVVFSGGAKETFPDDGYLRVVITAALA